MAKPQFTLSFLFILIAVLSFPALIAGRAWQGDGWALGVTVGLVGATVGLVVLFGACTASFLLLHAIHRMLAGRRRDLEIEPVADEVQP